MGAAFLDYMCTPRNADGALKALFDQSALTRAGPSVVAVTFCLRSSGPFVKAMETAYNYVVDAAAAAGYMAIITSSCRYGPGGKYMFTMVFSVSVATAAPFAEAMASANDIYV